jgi:hypothetical protein
MQSQATTRFTFCYWFRILRAHNRFSVYESFKFALWLASPKTVKLTRLGNGYCGIRLARAPRATAPHVARVSG